MLFWKKDFKSYYEKVSKFCLEYKVGEPEKGSDRSKMIGYRKEVHDNYIHFAKWLYDSDFNLIKEIRTFNTKYLSGLYSNKATRDLLNYKYNEWLEDMEFY